MRRYLLLFISISVLLLTAGCLPSRVVQEIELTVSFPNATTFYQKYGLGFENKFPHIKINVTPAGNVNELQPPLPDVILMDHLAAYEQAIQAGVLQSLDEIILREKFDIERFSPVVTGLLHSGASNELFGLAPAFSSHALYFNKQLFERYNVPLPRDQMSWEEVLELARRFPRESDGQRIYGFASNYYREIAFAMILRIGQTEGLSFIDPKTLDIHMNTDRWKKVWQNVIDSFRTGAINDAADDGTGEMKPSPILTGNTAMQIESEGMGYNFDAYRQMIGGKNIDWGVVTVPVDPRNPDYSDGYQLFEIYGISKSSEHLNEAWELIKYITSDTDNITRQQNELKLSGLPALTDQIRDIHGRDALPFYRLKPVTTSNNPYEEVGYEVMDAFKEAGQAIVEDVLKGNLSIDQALVEIEKKGKEAVQSVH